ncbi:MAG: prepilin-type N-terminal cleavage/methylation domain-containing protein [Acidimicrobiales bacterium]|jgi:prepilin-type N-terminal cleavage/methylation domain-containing protein
MFFSFHTNCKKQIQSGFSLIELMVTVAIVTLVTGVILIGYVSFDNITLLKSQALELALDIRTAQVYGVGSKVGSSVSREAYGIYVNLDSPDKYTMFRDGESSGTDLLYDTSDETIETFFLDPRFQISEICVVSGGFGHCNYQHASISFKSPDFDSNLTYQENTGSPLAHLGEMVDHMDFRVSSIMDPSSERVVVVYPTGQISVKTFSDVIEPPDVTPPANPTGLAATGGTAQISLTWNVNTELDFASYTLYRRPVGGSYSVIAGGLTSSSYVNTGLPSGTLYYYRVVAIDNVGNISGISNTANATTRDTIPPVNPTGLAATAAEERVTLNWSANSESDLAGYRVYRSGSSGGTYSSISGLLNTSNFNSTGLTNGTMYYFLVRAEDTTGNVSGNSNIANARPMDVTPPAPPSSLSAVGGTRQITLNWSNNTESDFSSYRVYRSNSSGGTYSQIASGLTSSGYVNTGLPGTGDTRYYYRVRAIDNAGNLSGNSNTANAITADTVAPANPRSLSAVGGTRRITLNWSNNTESDFSSYRVYRSNSNGGTYSQIASGLTSSGYANTGLPNSTRYYYRVRAIDNAGNLSGNSATVNAVTSTPPPPPPPPPSGGGGSVICTELYAQGLMSETIYVVDEEFGSTVSPLTMRGYHFWAKPVVRKMQSSQSVTHFVNIFAAPWSHEMAYQMGAIEKGSIVGKALMIVGIPLSWSIGVVDYAVDALVSLVRKG